MKKEKGLRTVVLSVYDVHVSVCGRNERGMSALSLDVCVDGFNLATRTERRETCGQIRLQIDPLRSESTMDPLLEKRRRERMKERGRA